MVNHVLIRFFISTYEATSPTSMYQLVCLEGVGLGEACTTHLTLVWLLPSVDPEVALQLEGVRAGIGTVGALVWPLPRVASHVALQLA